MKVYARKCTSEGRAKVQTLDSNPVKRQGCKEESNNVRVNQKTQAGHKSMDAQEFHFS